jgi:hypothetical protein
VTLRRLAALQWLGLLFGAGTWALGFIAGYGLTQAECGAAGARWGIANDLWQAIVMSVTVTCVLVAEAAAVTVVRRTRMVSYDADPPLARIRFLAIAAIVANAIFLMIALLAGVSALTNVVCRQA